MVEASAEGAEVGWVDIGEVTGVWRGSHSVLDVLKQVVGPNACGVRIQRPSRLSIQ